MAKHAIVAVLGVSLMIIWRWLMGVRRFRREQETGSFEVAAGVGEMDLVVPFKVTQAKASIERLYGDPRASGCHHGSKKPRAWVEIKERRSHSSVVEINWDSSVPARIRFEIIGTC